MRRLILLALGALVVTGCGGDAGSNTTTSTAAPPTTGATTTAAPTTAATSTTTTTTAAPTTTEAPATPEENLRRADGLARGLVAAIQGSNSSILSLQPWANDDVALTAVEYADFNRGLGMIIIETACTITDLSPATCNLWAHDDIARGLGITHFVDTATVEFDSAGDISGFEADVSFLPPQGAAFFTWLEENHAELFAAGGTCDPDGVPQDCGAAIGPLASAFAETDGYVAPEFGTGVVVETLVDDGGSGGTFTTGEGSGLCEGGTFENVAFDITDTLWWYTDEYRCDDGSGVFVLHVEIPLDPDSEGDPAAVLEGIWYFVAGQSDFALQGGGRSGTVFEPEWREQYTGDLVPGDRCSGC